MTRQLPRALRIALGLALAAAAMTSVALPVWAQPPATAGSRAPAASAAQAQKDADTARELTVAAFSRRAAAPPPGGPAAQIAAESARAKLAAPPEAKPEWTSRDGLQPGGKGMKITTPF